MPSAIVIIDCYIYVNIAYNYNNKSTLPFGVPPFGRSVTSIEKIALRAALFFQSTWQTSRQKPIMGSVGRRRVSFC